MQRVTDDITFPLPLRTSLSSLNTELQTRTALDESEIEVDTENLEPAVPANEDLVAQEDNDYEDYEEDDF